MVLVNDRLDVFGPTRGSTRGATLVAMTTTFALGAESSHLPACNFVSFTDTKHL